jgi:hypothetical protein
MLTIFSCPKPMRGHVAVTQWNAIKSWTMLLPKPEVIILGDEEGVRQISQELNLRHIPEVVCSEYGAPLVNSLFDEAQKASSYDTICYVNADIVLKSDFSRGIQRVRAEQPQALMVGQRWNVEIKDHLVFEGNWEEDLSSLVRKEGKLYPYFAIDYFVFPRNALGEIPPLAIGRPAWDNWVIYRALSLGLPVVDMTDAVMVVHLNHDYSHHPDGWTGAMKGEESRRNIELVGEVAHVHSLLDATHQLTRSGLRRKRRPYAHPFCLYKLLVLTSQSHQSLKPFVRLIKRMGDRISAKP